MPEAPTQWDENQIKIGASFLQSTAWAQFQAALGHKPHFLGGGGWSCLAIERSNRLGKYLFAPYGPNLGSVNELPAALAEMKSLGTQLGAAWLRIEPVAPLGVDMADLKQQLQTAGGRRAPHNVEPDTTRIVDISLPPDELLGGISSSTRSIIRKNRGTGEISFKTSHEPNDILIFSGMLDTVARRNGVGFFPPEYFLKQAQILMPQGMMHLELAFDSGQPVAGIVVHDYGQSASYTYAASVPEARQKSVSALLVWQAMVNAQSRGMRQFDLFGIAPEGASPKHPWYGFSMFKHKFGGEIRYYAGTWDVPLAKKYALYRAARRLHKVI